MSMGGYPKLVPFNNMRWRSDQLDPHGIRDMCDYGARRYQKGECDILAFDCLPIERSEIDAYMLEKYPGIKYVFGTGTDVLRSARSNWEERNKDSHE